MVVPCPPPACPAGYGNWYDAPLPLVQGGQATYFGASVPFDLGTLAAIEFAAMAGAESFRGAAEPEKRVYPGGAFDPMGMVSAAVLWCGSEGNSKLAAGASVGRSRLGTTRAGGGDEGLSAERCAWFWAPLLCSPRATWRS